MREGLSYTIVNDTTWPGTAYYVTVQTTTPNVLALLGPQQSAVFTNINSSGTGNLAWTMTSCSTAPGLTSTVTAGGTTTLTMAHTRIQVFTGSSAQTVKLPDLTLGPISMGYAICIYNQSTGALTVQTSATNAVATIASNTALRFTVLAGTNAAASWGIGLC